MTMYGYAHEELIFFEMPLTGSYCPKPANSRLARITVSGGVLTTREIVEYLKWVVPGDAYQWDVISVGNNVFKVLFPSESEIDRLQRFGTFQVPNSSCSIMFDTWANKMEPLWKLQEIWLRVSGLHYEVLGDFLALWGLGSLFGKTLKVDMPFTRNTGVLRIFIGCVDPTLIPAQMDVFIRDGFHVLSFTVERPPRVNNGDGKKDDSNDNDPPAKDKNWTETENSSADVHTFDGGEGVVTPKQATINTVLPVIQFGSVPLSTLSDSHTRQTWADMTEDDECRGYLSEPPRRSLRTLVPGYARATESAKERRGKALGQQEVVK